ncbi:MAG: hypothetical protein IBX50_12525 [Marinospirillum sp.]|uniref:hypothetical protein n=1 Tax=Marinospirillum sp. TaxID=2183934 RepID=UPI0019F591C7|nr:hypothetical protein [Marinospirillum sp.]MBE0507522.1 hypothetical protein [Marinospirillum sp.]
MLNNDIKKLIMIRDLLIGSQINKNTLELIKHQSALFECKDGSETFDTTNTPQYFFGLKKIENDLTINFIKSNNELDRENQHYLHTVNKDTLEEITNKILPPKGQASYKTKRITVLLPHSASKINSKEELMDKFQTQWKHYHVSEFENLDDIQKSEYCLRLYTAFFLLRHANIKTTKDKPSTFISAIKTFDISDFFHIFKEEDYEEFKKKNKTASKITEESCIELLAKQIAIEDVLRENKYYFFQGSNFRIKENSETKVCAKSIAERLKAPISGLVEQRYDKVNLESDSFSNPGRGEADRQRMLQGLAYILTLFNGEIITVELPLSRKYHDKQSSKSTGDDENTEIKKTGRYLSIDQPAIICPSPIAGMLLDLQNHHQRLDEILGNSPIKSKKEKNINLNKLKLNSIYTIHLLVNHTKMQPADLDSLMEIIGHFKRGAEPEELIRMLNDNKKITVKNNYLGDAKPRISVELPILYPY